MSVSYRNNPEDIEQINIKRKKGKLEEPQEDFILFEHVLKKQEKLTPIEAVMLREIMTNKITTKDRLIEAIWLNDLGWSGIPVNAVTHIYTLLCYIRQKLKPNVVIRTIYGQGFIIERRTK